MIKRHFQPSDSMLDRKLKRYQRYWEPVLLQGIQKNPEESLGDNTNKTLDVLASSITKKSNREDSIQLLEIAHLLSLTNFQSSFHPGKIFKLDLAGDLVEFIGTETTAYMHTDMWLDAMYLAIILRDSDSIQALCTVSESTFQNANIQPDSFDLNFVKVIKGLFNPDANIAQLLVDASGDLDFDLNTERHNYHDLILWSQFPLFRCILSKDSQPEFNEKLEEAVLGHQKYWSQKSKKDDPQGWISLPLIAASALAFDNKGYEITFETDYIPEWLVKKEF